MQSNIWWVGALILALVCCTDEDGSSQSAEMSAHGIDAVQTKDTPNQIPDTKRAGKGIQYAFMPVHMEPGNSPVDPKTGVINLERPKTYFADLVALVEAADVHEHKLTLMFTPQWAAYLVDPGCTLPPSPGLSKEYLYQDAKYSDCLSLVRGFEAHGHEIALHHHPLTAPSTWDGFTDEASWKADRDGKPGEETYYADGSGASGVDPFYLGDLSALMSWLDKLSADGPGNIYTATTEEFPESIRYLAVGGPASYSGKNTPGDLVSRPCQSLVGERQFWQLRMRLYTSKNSQNSVLQQELPAAISDYKEESGAQTVGFVTHARNVADRGIKPYDELFKTLAEFGLKLERVRDVMAHYPEVAMPKQIPAGNFICP